MRFIPFYIRIPSLNGSVLETERESANQWRRNMHETRIIWLIDGCGFHFSSANDKIPHKWLPFAQSAIDQAVAVSKQTKVKQRYILFYCLIKFYLIYKITAFYHRYYIDLLDECVSVFACVCHDVHFSW